MTYYARFENRLGHLFRFDTRIYLAEHDIKQEGKCIGAIVAKNPGSASPSIRSQLGTLGAIELGDDKMLPTVRKRFKAAYVEAEKLVPMNAYIRVWNLFYLCNPELNAACSAMNAFTDPPSCATEDSSTTVVWFAWGSGDARLNSYKRRFASRSYLNAFYYDKRTGLVVDGIPGPTDFAKHPQGLLASPIVKHLARAV